MPDVFVWYHADDGQEAEFQTWIQQLKSTIPCQAKLYKRQQNKKTTFMEVFEHIDSATMKKIEQLATQQACFQGVQRQCESFERILCP
ncbi:MAG: hypothetical protein Q9M11_01225 [Mariprofundaceae bacterium]|nr:hypothetical protein [Mariprofundaceae bacterium]